MNGALRTSNHRSRESPGAEGRGSVQLGVNRFLEDRVKLQVQEVLVVALANVPDAVQALFVRPD